MNALKNPLKDMNITRRSAVALGVGTVAALGLAACSNSPSNNSNNNSSSYGTSSGTGKALDTAAYDKLIASGDIAKPEEVDAYPWAAAIKAAGVLRVGGTRTSQLFSLLDEKDNKIRGFDAALYQLLARYILGDETKYTLEQVTSSTRETLLQNGTVNTVIATYSITEDRKKVISFAGPYYEVQQAILVLNSNKDISSVNDLNDKAVAVQSGSTGPTIVAEVAPKAKVEEFTTDEEARQALEQNRVQAYVVDETLQLGNLVRNPGKYKIVGETFGPKDKYGIGLPLNSDGVTFVNTWLKKLEDDGIWKSLWNITIGERVGASNVDDPPTIGVL